MNMPNQQGNQMMDQSHQQGGWGCGGQDANAQQGQNAVGGHPMMMPQQQAFQPQQQPQQFQQMPQQQPQQQQAPMQQQQQPPQQQQQMRPNRVPWHVAIMSNLTLLGLYELLSRLVLVRDP